MAKMTAASKLFDLGGRVAFVSGAAGHLGRPMARGLCEAGAHVILNGRDDAKLKAFEDELRRDGLSAERAVFDVSDFASARTFMASHSRLDILVNNAISMSPAPFASLTADAFDLTYRSAVTAAFEPVRSALPALRAAVAVTGDASVVNVASMYGNVAPDSRIYAKPEQASPLHYGPAKAALLQLTRHLAAELGPEKIRVNALVPGPFPQAAVAANDPAFAHRLAAKTMLGRTGNASEIAGPLLFLASPAASYVTGSELAIDGGWTAW
jgi:NAD(P)-dependent dehydrogenase (short-subunit alcohol dehydrogenase family)